MQHQQNKVLKFHLSWKISVVLEGEIYCIKQLFLKAETGKRDSALPSKVSRFAGFPIALYVGLEEILHLWFLLKWIYLTSKSLFLRLHFPSLPMDSCSEQLHSQCHCPGIDSACHILVIAKISSYKDGGLRGLWLLHNVLFNWKPCNQKDLMKEFLP